MVTKDYVAGFLENIGGFYIFHHKKRRDFIPRFKILTGKDNRVKVETIDKCMRYLMENHKVIYNNSFSNKEVIFTINQANSLINLIEFLEKNCKIKKEHQDKVKECILLKKTIATQKRALDEKYKLQLSKLAPTIRVPEEVTQ